MKVEINRGTRWQGSLFLFFFFSVALPWCVSAQTTRLPVVLFLCVDGPADTSMDFMSRINQYTSVSVVAVGVSCGAGSSAVEKEKQISLWECRL